MSYVWFNSVLEALGKRINFESISNLYGNSFAKDSAKVIQGCNPLTRFGSKGPGTGVMGLMGQIKVVEAKTKDAEKAAVKKQLGNLDWAEGLF